MCYGDAIVWVENIHDVDASVCKERHATGMLPYSLPDSDAREYMAKVTLAHVKQVNGQPGSVVVYTPPEISTVSRLAEHTAHLSPPRRTLELPWHVKLPTLGSHESRGAPGAGLPPAGNPAKQLSSALARSARS